MNIYTVVSGLGWYLMPAPNIQAASQFVRHWPGVKVRRVTDEHVVTQLHAKSLARSIQSDVQRKLYTREELQCLLSGINTG